MSSISPLAVSGEDSLVEVLYQLRIVIYTCTAALAILVFDYLLTVGDEIELIWSRKWSIGKVLFFLVRYPVFADTVGYLYSETVFVSAEQCRTMQSFTIFSNAVGSCLSEFILVLRTYALWNCNKKILIFLLALWTAVTISTFIIVTEFIRPEQFGPPPTHAAPACALVVGVKPRLALAEYICIMIIETVILALTVYSRLSSFHHSGSPIFNIVYRDGIMYFVYTVLSSLVNICFLAAAPLALCDLFVLIHRVLQCSFSTRILLHLHQASRGDAGDVYVGTEHSIPLEFAPSSRSFALANSTKQSSILVLEFLRNNDPLYVIFICSICGVAFFVMVIRIDAFIVLIPMTGTRYPLRIHTIIDKHATIM